MCRRLNTKLVSRSHRPPSVFVLLQIAILISIGFIGCWAPYGMVSLWSIFRDASTIPPEVTLLPCMFAKSSTMYNPLIYYIFSQSFQREVKQMQGPCFSLCQTRNSITDNNIYLVSAHMKSKAAAAGEGAQDPRVFNPVTLD